MASQIQLTSYFVWSLPNKSHDIGMYVIMTCNGLISFYTFISAAGQLGSHSYNKTTKFFYASPQLHACHCTIISTIAKQLSGCCLNLGYIKTEHCETSLPSYSYSNHTCCCIFMTIYSSANHSILIDQLGMLAWP